MTPELKAAVERVERDLRDGQESSEVSNHDLRLILAALAEREWRPIETAPKDGTVVLVYFPVFGRAFACEFDGGRWQTGVWTAKPQTATHWMPLPDGPETQQPGERGE